MPTDRDSLLAGRNGNPLNDAEITRVFNTFLGLEREIPVRYEPGTRTCCRSAVTAKGEVYAEIVFSADIFGIGVVDPNSSLGVQAAAAHELSHYHRWHNKTELTDPNLAEVDEALASLEAIQRYAKQLSDHEVRQLVADATQRLQLYAQRKAAEAKKPTKAEPHAE